MTIMKKETAVAVTLNASGVTNLPMRKETRGFNPEHV